MLAAFEGESYATPHHPVIRPAGCGSHGACLFDILHVTLPDYDVVDQVPELSTCNWVTTGREADAVCTRRSGRVPFVAGQSCVV